LRSPESAAIGPLKRMDSGPIFDEPWQAQVLGIADVLSKAGAFTPSQWSETLGQELRRAEANGAADDLTTYYEAALLALERLIVRASFATSEALANRRADWIRAYLATPHGQAVNLGDG
jgi:nitrile hydratase accessory protein